MNLGQNTFLLGALVALSACAFAAPSRVNESFYREIGSATFSPSKAVDVERCVYFAFFDNRFGEFQVRREETHTGQRVNMQARTYDLLSADIDRDGTFKIFKYYSAPSVPWVRRVVEGSLACASRNTQ